MASCASGENTVMIHRVSSGELLQTLEGHTGEVLSVAFSPVGNPMASVSADGTIILWDTLYWTQRRSFPGGTNLAFSSNGRILASGAQDGSIFLYDPTSGALLQTLQGHTGAVLSLAFPINLPPIHTLASGSADGTINIWQFVKPSQDGDR